MPSLRHFLPGIFTLAAAFNLTAAHQVLFEATSQYHHVYVTDDNGLRLLFFDDTTESRMSLQDPLKGHFEYTEYFHMPWIWNPQATNVLTIGLGGSSIQRSFEHYYPAARIQAVEIDPVVAHVAKTFFQYKESDRQKLHVMDGRVFLRRSTEKYDVIVLDAYTEGRYGASIPPHLVTKEFFEIAKSHMTTNGVMAYNVITTLRDWNTDMVGAMYRTMKEVFPQVYWFEATSSRNAVLIATQSPTRIELPALKERAAEFVKTNKLVLPGFLERLNNFKPQAPANFQRCPILSDDFAPVEGLIRSEGVRKK
jgi:spermidine synthase